jgi:hypothetical protein
MDPFRTPLSVCVLGLHRKMAVLQAYIHLSIYTQSGDKWALITHTAVEKRGSTSKRQGAECGELYSVLILYFFLCLAVEEEVFCGFPHLVKARCEWLLPVF